MAMTPQELRDAAEQLREQDRWMQRSEVDISVELEEEDYYVDLGAFGEQSMAVSISTDYYSIDPADIFDHGPTMGSGDLERLADELDAVAEKLDEANASNASLGVVLQQMKETGTDKERALAVALQAVCDAVDGILPVPTISVGTLPAEPLPWPGALNPEIDYTAADFPLRYQPPPGFVWASGSNPVHYHAARCSNATTLGSEEMHIDDKGRVCWTQRAPDSDYSGGERWRVWHDEREQDGITIPSARGYSYDVPPRALDELGRVISEPHTDGTEYGNPDYNWSGDASAYEKVRKARAASLAKATSPAGNGGFAPPAPVSL